MVRVVPVVHRAPPPPPENPFQVPEAQPSSSSLPAQLAPSILQKHLRRNYITSHVPSGSPLHLSNHNSASKVASEAAIGQKQFSLFDYLQNLAITEAEFADGLAKEGLKMKVVQGDGNCMFRAVADQIYGDEDMHEQVRTYCLDYMEQEADFFSNYVSIDFADYVRNKRKLRVFGDHLELQAMAELFNRPVEIRIPGQKTLRIGEVEAENAKEVLPLRLSYHNNNHYNSIQDPKNPALGFGLGLPANQKPTTDKTLVAQAVEVSLRNETERQLLETAKLESEQEQVDEYLIIDAAMKESEMMALEDQLVREYKDGLVPEMDLDDSLAEEADQDELLARQLAEQMEDEELERAIALSLQESGN